MAIIQFRLVFSGSINNPKNRYWPCLLIKKTNKDFPFAKIVKDIPQKKSFALKSYTLLYIYKANKNSIIISQTTINLFCWTNLKCRVTVSIMCARITIKTNILGIFTAPASQPASSISHQLNIQVSSVSHAVVTHTHLVTLTTMFLYLFVTLRLLNPNDLVLREV